MRLVNATGGGSCRPRVTRFLPVLLLVAVAFRICFASWRVKELAHWARGICGNSGYIIPFKEQGDSLPLLVFSGMVPGTWLGLHFYRYAPIDKYALVKVDTGNLSGSVGLIPGNLLPWAVGSLDGDSDPELIGYNQDLPAGYSVITAYVPPAGSEVPDSLICSARYGVLMGDRYCLSDLDLDGKREVSFRSNYSHRIMVYEWGPGDSLRQTISLPCESGATLATGDFDQDGLIEVGTSGLGGSMGRWIMIYKCTGDDQLVPWDSVFKDYPNGGDAFSASNLDGSHRAVFFVSYYAVGWFAWLYEVEPTSGTRGYQPVLVDSTRVRSNLSAHSVCGDIDGDGVEELLWSTGNQIRMYKCAGPHQYELEWVWNQGDSNSCNLNVYDMNGNGYNEILESGNGLTHIFEIEAIKVLYPNASGLQFHPGDTCRIRWETYFPPRCDSVSLFLRTDTIWSLADTIAHGIAPSETSYAWIVPDLSRNYRQGDTPPRTAGSHPSLDSCRIVAIAYGPGWQYDESDYPFRIVSSGVAEDAQPRIRETKLLGIFPNPVSDGTSIRFQLREPCTVSLSIADASGRILNRRVKSYGLPGRYDLAWDASLFATGIYFLSFSAGDQHKTQKLVVAR
jgi:hypothetical protein